jgi:hypothetical protein
VGIMTRSNVKQYKRKHYNPQNFWDFILDEFIID